VEARDSHAAIDGEQRDLEELFSNGCMQPLDPSADPAEICNCRCACGYTVRGEAEGELE
jgi:hypothetical protein